MVGVAGERVDVPLREPGRREPRQPRALASATPRRRAPSRLLSLRALAAAPQYLGLGFVCVSEGESGLGGTETRPRAR